jgi:predicted DNA-binding transcriptional regulator AlpA
MPADFDDISPRRLLYRYPEATNLLGFSEQGLRDLVWKRRGPAVIRVGSRSVRFAHSDLLDWIARNREPAPASPPSALVAAKRRRGRPSVAERQSGVPP